MVCESGESEWDVRVGCECGARVWCKSGSGLRECSVKMR